MSIYIKGVKMPTGDKAIHLEIHKDGTVLMWQMGDSDKVVGEAISIPKGRLIDADVLYDHMCRTHDKWRENPQEYMSINPFTDDETMILYAPPSSRQVRRASND